MGTNKFTRTSPWDPERMRQENIRRSQRARAFHMQALAHGVNSSDAGVIDNTPVVFSPVSLFTASLPGASYDPSDLSTMFQDSAGTTPAVVDSPVGKINDKSGNGNHLIQATAGFRPILRTAAGLFWLEFDGIDDFLATAAPLPLSTTDKVSIFVSQMRVDSTPRMLLETSLNAFSLGTGSFFLLTGADTFNGYNSFSRGSAAGTGGQVGGLANLTNPDTAMLTAVHDIAGDLSSFRSNGIAGTSGVADKGTGNFENQTLYVGSRGNGSFPSNMRLYGLTILGRLATGPESASMETSLGGKAGLTL